MQQDREQLLELDQELQPLDQGRRQLAQQGPQKLGLEVQTTVLATDPRRQTLEALVVPQDLHPEVAVAKAVHQEEETIKK